MAERLTTYFDFASPFSYLGCTQIASVCAEHGAELTWHPLLLGAIFKEIGTPMVPMMAVSNAKLRHTMLDLARYADRWGVPFRWPTRFPMVTVRPLRLVLAAQVDVPDRAEALIQRIYRAFWAEDQDISQAGVLIELAREVAVDGEALVARTGDPEVKQALFDHTREALEAGVFGVPTFRIGDDLIWGQDRLELVAWRLGDAE